MIRMQLHTGTKTLPFCTAVDVVLPQCSRGVKPEEFYTEENRLPVLFLLHGGGGSESDWFRFTRIEELAEEKQVCVVCPTAQNSTYVNMYRGYRWFDYMTKELYEFVHAVLPVSSDREKNFVAGLSMGGYGALHMALSCPEKYGYAAALSSAVGLTEEVANNVCPLPMNGLSIFGPADQVRGSENDLFHVAKQLAASNGIRPRIFSACGTEDFTYQSNVAFKDLLASLDYDLTWKEGPGAHTWDFWNQYIYDVFDWLPV